MKGTMLIYDVDATKPRRVEIEKPTLDALQKAVGGKIETVPYFDHIKIDGQKRECVAFCNEEGKLDQLPINKQATLIWEQVVSNVGMKLRDRHGNFLDVLVGPIVVLYGDDEFMRRYDG